MELKEFLVWITGGGAIVMVSWAFERWNLFQGLTSEKKEAVMFLSALSLSFASFAVATFVPAEILNQLAPWFLIASATFSTIFLGKMFHKIDKK